MEDYAYFFCCSFFQEDEESEGYIMSVILLCKERLVFEEEIVNAVNYIMLEAEEESGRRFHSALVHSVRCLGKRNAERTVSPYPYWFSMLYNEGDGRRCEANGYAQIEEPVLDNEALRNMERDLSDEKGMRSALITNIEPLFGETQ